MPLAVESVWPCPHPVPLPPPARPSAPGDSGHGMAVSPGASAPSAALALGLDICLRWHLLPPPRLHLVPPQTHQSRAHLAEPTLLRFRAHHELWVPAHHDTLLALLNREAHQLAARGASSPAPWAIPLPQHLPSPLLLYYRGTLVLQPQLGLDQAYEDATAATYYTGRRASCL